MEIIREDKIFLDVSTKQNYPGFQKHLKTDKIHIE